MTRTISPTVAAITTSLLVGAALVATRFVIGETTPFALAFLRYGIGFGCLIIPTLLGPRTPLARQDWLPIGVLGMVQFGVVVGLLNYALQFIPSARVALLFATSPLMTLVIAVALRRKRANLPRIISVVLAVAGVGLALGESVMRIEPNHVSWLGDGAVLVSAGCAAGCSVL